MKLKNARRKYVKFFYILGMGKAFFHYDMQSQNHKSKGL